MRSGHAAGRARAAQVSGVAWEGGNMLSLVSHRKHTALLTRGAAYQQPPELEKSSIYGRDRRKEETSLEG